MESKEMEAQNSVDALFKAGAHYGYAKSRRHPTVSSFIFGAKNGTEIFDLEETLKSLRKACDFVKTLAVARKQVLFVGSKNEALEIVKIGALSIDMPYVASRFIGGALTNFSEIRKRVDRLEKLMQEKERGELDKYTKKERLLIDREIEKLSNSFVGILPMRSLPAAIFVVDSGKESIAVAEAKKMNIPVISLSGSDCDIRDINYPIVGNDSLKSSIEFFIKVIVDAYKDGRDAITISA